MARTYKGHHQHVTCNKTATLPSAIRHTEAAYKFSTRICVQ